MKYYQMRITTPNNGTLLGDKQPYSEEDMTTLEHVLTELLPTSGIVLGRSAGLIYVPAHLVQRSIIVVDVFEDTEDD